MLDYKKISFHCSRGMSALTLLASILGFLSPRRLCKGIGKYFSSKSERVHQVMAVLCKLCAVLSCIALFSPDDSAMQQLPSDLGDPDGLLPPRGTFSTAGTAE